MFLLSLVCILHSLFLLLKSETNTETETNFRILPIYFFFGIKNVRVGQSIGNTHIFFLASAVVRNKQVCVVLEEGIHTCRFKKKKKSLPTDPNFEDHAIGNTQIFFWSNH